MIRNRKTCFVSLSLLLLLLSSIALGQGGVATGDLNVTVKDPNGDLVANATVTASDVAKGLERTATEMVKEVIASGCFRREAIPSLWERRVLARPKPGT